MEHCRSTIITVPALCLCAKMLVLVAVAGVQHGSVMLRIAQFWVLLEKVFVAAIQEVDLGIMQRRIRILIAVAIVISQEA